jgi:hypothetical protein
LVNDHVEQLVSARRRALFDCAIQQAVHLGVKALGGAGRSRGQRPLRRGGGIHPRPQISEPLSLAPIRDLDARTDRLLGQPDEAERIETGRHLANVPNPVMASKVSRAIAGT